MSPSASRSSRHVGNVLTLTLTPFLYPALSKPTLSRHLVTASTASISWQRSRGISCLTARRASKQADVASTLGYSSNCSLNFRHISSSAHINQTNKLDAQATEVDEEDYHKVLPRRVDPLSGDGPKGEDATLVNRLDPLPDDYSRSLFTDRCSITLHAGGGGHGCVSFLREKYIANGPANGGDGGSGGNIYIQAVQGETSLHKLARRGILKAGRGRNGRGKNKGGERGEDVLLQVPVGTVVREISRYDPLAEEEERRKLYLKTQKKNSSILEGEESESEQRVHGSALTDFESQSIEFRRDKWLLHPASAPSDFATTEFPPLPRVRRSHLSMMQLPAPISLDLSKPMEQPLLLAAGAAGGLGNPHFISRSVPRPKYATKGEPAMRLELELELKLLADVGLVGLPNAGKSTLLRSLSRSRTRVGNWAFTTLQPNIGTVVLDNYKGRPKLFGRDSQGRHGKDGPRTKFTIADIPGLIPGAHQDRGLGLGFLRHIERAGILGFVVDLGAGDAVESLKGLWREVAAYEKLRAVAEETQDEISKAELELELDPDHDAQHSTIQSYTSPFHLSPLASDILPISAKPWLVVATKADLSETQDNFVNLQRYLDAVASGQEAHPSGKEDGWRDGALLRAVPVSAIRAEGIERIVDLAVDILDSQ
ncbi:GTP-binding protein Obg/CgtA [Xylona heveae TC161]|uniref:GTP-binding protein Obg/CgtA n=1 Tax=Xylona heveae (strain CBS 132557 / TC161) TaxID=1328760 RepID=A0A165ILN6_XYLHT|nr:GTP-binding protein Obg/CgtA [Xylona heveae TC161]KZF25075.1 GTP-binding protein Obg/CgtA [Xylona heveae TC161]